LPSSKQHRGMIGRPTRGILLNSVKAEIAQRSSSMKTSIAQTGAVVARDSRRAPQECALAPIPSDNNAHRRPMPNHRKSFAKPSGNDRCLRSRLESADCVEESPRPASADSGCDGDQGGRFEPFASCGEDRRRKGDELRQFPRFWAVAANRNSSLAPLGPRRRNRSSPRMRLR
jgi:hypothetical protein